MIESDRSDIYDTIKSLKSLAFISNFIHQRILQITMISTKNVKQNNWLIIKKKISNTKYITMIPEGSWDTEDWSNDAENSALSSINYIL